MNFPSFYQPQRVGTLYVPNTIRAVEAGRANPVTTSANARTLLLLVDMQIDFVHVDGALSVPGAVDDTRRVIEWIFKNVSGITKIAASLDSHLPISIFFPTWWADVEGQHPAPYTVIRSIDVKAGRWKPLYQHAWSMHYCEKLESLSKKALMIWPYHTLIGTPGHTLTPALYEAIAYHSAACQKQPLFLQKGTIPETEFYSILEPEVKMPDHAAGGLNVEFLDTLATYDRVYVAGEAKSHCVLETIASIMRYFAEQPEMIAKFRVLEDCMASVAHPTINFEAMAMNEFSRYATQGLKMIRSSDPLE